MFESSEHADRGLADCLIVRLNILIRDPDVKKVVTRLIEKRVSAKEELLDHPTIIVHTVEQPEGFAPKVEVGFLGLLNGLIGRVGGSGPHQAYGLVTAVFDDNGELECFRRTKEP